MCLPTGESSGDPGRCRGKSAVVERLDARGYPILRLLRTFRIKPSYQLALLAGRDSIQGGAVPFKVVITDTTAEDYEVERRLFADAGFDLEVVYLQTREPSVVRDHAADADAVVVAWAPLTREVIASLRRCRLIVRYGIGVDMIDLDAATEQGIVVCNTARYCIEEVSAHAISFLLLLNRQILPLHRSMQNGGWGSPDIMPPRRLAGQQLGLIGLGNIGRAVAAKARGLGLRVVACDPFVQAGSVQDGVQLVGLAELLTTSDYVSIHCPLTASTRHLIGRRELALMRPTAFLINCARGAVIDQSALVEALARRRIAGAALDVFETEPLAVDDPLRRLDNVILTPHVAHWSVESAIECRRTAVEHVLAALRGEIPPDVVNRAVLQRPHRLCSEPGRVGSGEGGEKRPAPGGHRG